jgi:hypothetical protein
MGRPISTPAIHGISEFNQDENPNRLSSIITFSRKTVMNIKTIFSLCLIRHHGMKKYGGKRYS